MKSKVLRFLLSLAIALGIWLYVVSVVSPESEATIFQVPVMLEGEKSLAERDLIIVSDKNFTVDLKLFGNRVDLNKLTASNITLQADLSQITEPGEHNIRYSIAYPAVVEPGNVEVLEKDPQHITITVVETEWKEVPVKVEYGTSRVPDGYVVDRQNPQFDHDTVIVSGPKETLEYVQYAKIDVDLTGKVSTIDDSYKVILCDARGNDVTRNEGLKYVDKLSTNINAIRAKIQIYKIKEVPLVVEVIPGGGLREEDVVLTLSQQSIVVSGSDRDLEKLDQIVVGTVKLAELMESTRLAFDVELPAKIDNITGVDEVTVDIELPELEVRTYAVTQIRTENVPGNRGVKLVNQVLNVQIRGTKEALDSISAADIQAIVNCEDVAGMSNTTTRLSVTIVIAGETTAGAVGEYYVVVEVTEINSSTGG